MGFRVNGVKFEVSLLYVGNLIKSWSLGKFFEITFERSTEILCVLDFYELLTSWGS